MSNLSDQTQFPCHFESSECGHIDLIVTPKDKDLGGFCVRRLLPNALLKSVGPWIFFDHMGPATFEPEQEFKVRPHPHIGIATVTYLFEGEIVHRDSLGTEATITPGAINLMITGSGMVHSERQSPEMQATRRNLHGLQLWLALPEDQQEADPAFYHYPADDIPSTAVDGVQVRVMMGRAYGLESPVVTLSDTLYVEAKLRKGQSLTLPESAERAMYVVTGRVMARHTELKAHSFITFKPSDGEAVVITAEEDTQIAILGGAPLGPRHVEWNFVSTSPERIEKAKQDWVDGNFPKVPGDEQEFIPLPK
ncbi:MAG: pirin family protein [Idiomarina sp.]|nr:pirin family protein [Idiomarina sp.]